MTLRGVLVMAVVTALAAGVQPGTAGADAVGIMEGGYRSLEPAPDARAAVTVVVPSLTERYCDGTSAGGTVQVTRATRSDYAIFTLDTACEGGLPQLAAGLHVGGESFPIQKTITAGDELVVRTSRSGSRTRIEVASDRWDWSVVRFAPGRPDGVFSAEVVVSFPGSRGPLTRQRFEDFEIDGRPFGRFAHESFANGCTKVGRLAQGRAFTVSYAC